MKLFTIDEIGKFIPFKERNFSEEHKEIDLEALLEKNPDYFFDTTKILIIGRQVTTNLSTTIDLLGVDAFGNTVVIELKRDKTPRETLSQLLEYASFIDNLDYEQLNEIYENYTGDTSDLEADHREYYQMDSPQEAISWNKSSKLVIVASHITAEIKQTALYLRKKGIDIYCVEFKYFVSRTKTKMLSSDFVVGDEEFIKSRIRIAAPLTRTDKQQFFDALDQNGKIVFESLIQFAERERLMLRWGSKGFSLNQTFGSAFVGLCFGYPSNSVYKQSIYSGFEEITKKINHPEEVIDFYRAELKNFGKFKMAQTNMKWVIGPEASQADIEAYILVLQRVIKKIASHGLKAG